MSDKPDVDKMTEAERFKYWRDLVAGCVDLPGYRVRNVEGAQGDPTITIILEKSSNA